MHSDNRAVAEGRKEQILAFRRELQQLEQQGVLQLDTEQAQSVASFHNLTLKSLSEQHDVDLSHSARQLSLGMQVVSFLGAWALAASVFFFFYQYWGYLPTLAQVSVLVAAPLLTLLITYWIARIDTALYFAKLTALISFACFVIDVSLLGTLFNLPASSLALALFSAYAALLAYALNIKLLLAVALLCVFAFIGAQTATWSGGYWLSLGDHPENFLLPTWVMFWLPSVISQVRYSGFANIYRVLSLVGFFVAVLVLSNWGQSSYLSASSAMVEGLYQVVGFGVSGAVIWLAIRNGWQAVMATGNVFFALFLFTKFFDWWWDWLPKSIFFLLIGLTAVLALVVFSRLRRTAQQEVAL